MSKTLTTWANKVTGEFEKDIVHAVGLFSEYMENASLAEPDAKGRMPWDLDFHYLINNICGSIWQQMYGNTTVTKGNDDPKWNDPNNFWKAVHVKARADKALADYVVKHPECDIDNPHTFLPEIAAEDLTFTSLMSTAERAEKRFDALQGMLTAYIRLYMNMYEDAWVYKPYGAPQEKLARSMTPQQEAVAAKLRAMKNKDTAAA